MTTYVPAHPPGTCQTCDMVRAVGGETWTEAAAPDDCSQCIVLPSATGYPAPAPVVQANIPTPHAMPHAPAIEGTTARLPKPAGEDHAPAVKRPRAGRRPGMS